MPGTYLKYSEQQLHRDVAKFLSYALPAAAFFSTFPSGGGGRLRGAQLKEMGLKAGVPDVMVIYQGRAFFLELKTEAGRLSADQHLTIISLGNAGALVAVCRSIDHVEEALTTWGIGPLRATAANYNFTTNGLRRHG